MSSHFHPISRLGLSIGVGGIAFNVASTTRTIHTTILGFDTRARWMLFSQNGFNLGLGLGYQIVSGSSAETIPVTVVTIPYNVLANVKLIVKSFLISPFIGYQWSVLRKYFIGIDLGLHVPIAPNTSVSVTSDDAVSAGVIEAVKATDQYKSMEADARAKGNQFGANLLPYVALFRFGYYF